MSRGALQVLEDLHSQLDLHFHDLHEARMEAPRDAPVFALEHGLSEPDLVLLKEAVRSAVRQGFGSVFRRWWLPFVVYAAESGYEYAGDEYWQTFEESTPGWEESGDRDRIRAWFEKFASVYGGAVPRGAFAEHFTIIAWPITHAVLPTDLQRSLAMLLYEFRAGLTAELLHDPEQLGLRLAARTASYSDRFRRFCDNAGLLGQVSVALLSGEDSESPYLLRSTLRRLVAGLSHERESRLWLRAAQRTAQHLRTSTRGFVPSPRPSSQPARSARLPAPTDPRLLLRRAEHAWRAYAELPDLSSLIVRLPQLSEELRSRRPRLAGAERNILPRGYLLYPGEVRLARLPGPEEPFISLERASGPVNQLIADQAVISTGPVWLFSCRGTGLAVEVKGKFIHPAASYVLVTRGPVPVPRFPWVTQTAIDADGVRAFSINVPEAVSDEDMAAFSNAGILTASEASVRPVGVVASNWDGQGSVEWPAGEPGMIGIFTDRVPETCAVTVDGQCTTLAWPGQQRQLLVKLDDLGAGTHEASVTLAAAEGKTIAEGSLVVTIRDPHVRPDGAAPGEGIRLLADPVQPTLSDLWDGRAAISVDGPQGCQAGLTVTLLSGEGQQLAEIDTDVRMPLTLKDWLRTAAGIRVDRRFQSRYDDAQSARITVTRAGIGFASLTCDRGFQALRWRVARRHDGTHAARLVDRTDGTRTYVDLFRVSDPLTAVPRPAGREVAIPAQGGLLRATAGDARATILLPTQPTEFLRKRAVPPAVTAHRRVPEQVVRLAEAHQMWGAAERPADPFAAQQQARVLEAITSAVVSLIAGERWAQLEKILRNGDDAGDLLDAMQRLVGDSPHEKEVARQIAVSLWRWSDPEQLVHGFTLIIARATTESPEVMARVLLALAARPGWLMDGRNVSDHDRYLRKVLADPALLRAARFAVLGARAMHSPDAILGGIR